ncbi:PqiC family protein [Nitratifractor sp.]
MNRRLLTLLLSLGLLLLTGCSSKNDFYRLQPAIQSAHSGSAPLHRERILGIGEVQVADYLRKHELVTRVDSTRLDVHENDLWAGDLEKNIQQVLRANLGKDLPRVTVLAYPWSEPLDDRYRLYLSVDRFDGDLNGTVTLSGHWSLVDQYDNRLVTGERFRYFAQGAPETEALVETQSRLLDRLSRRIAAKIRRYF